MAKAEKWKTSVQSLAIFVKAMLSSIVLSLALYTKAYIPNVHATILILFVKI